LTTNIDPFQDEPSLWTKLTREGVDKYKMAGAKVALIGVMIFFFGELLAREEVSTVGLWVFLAGFAVFGLCTLAGFVLKLKKIDEETDEAVRRAAEARQARSE
jgi:hypothetical protein